MKLKNYRTLILVGLLAFLFLFIYLISPSDRLSSGAFWLNLTISSLFLVAIAVIDYYLITYLNGLRWFKVHLKSRITTEFAVISLIAVLFVFIGNLPFGYEGDLAAYLLKIAYSKAIVASILLNIFTVTVIELYVQIKRNHQLQEESARMRYSQLKAQINPHFLFNSLNALVSLIHSDSDRAAHYTQKLSEVYRYVLTYDEQEVVTTAQEVAFIESYLDILQIRYGEGLQTTINIDATHHTHRIPTMSLQVLVENAVKHNTVSATHPLHLTITSSATAPYIVVSNNINPRITVAQSLGIGLPNLELKYRLLSNQKVVVERSPQTFTVKLPLL